MRTHTFALDCGYHSLAWTHLSFDYESLMTNPTPITIHNAIRKEGAGVVDLFVGEKVSDVSQLELARRMKKYLAALPIPPDTKVNIEFQAPKFGQKANTVSTVVMNMLVMFYCDYPLRLIHASKKNSFKFTPELTWSHYLKTHLLPEYPTMTAEKSHKYRIRKQHAVDSMMYLDKLFNLNMTAGVDKKRYADLADSMLLCLL